MCVFCTPILPNRGALFASPPPFVWEGGSWARTALRNPTTATAVYNVANELTNGNGATLAYDSNGNMTSDGTNTYTRDAQNQPASISGVIAASFVYDPFGRRQGKTVNGRATSFLYDSGNPVQELLGTTVTANLLTGLSVDEYLTRTDASGTSNFLTDALGSTLALADPTGTVQTQYTYDPFGGTTLQGAVNANSYQLTGREDDGTELYFYRARYYNPTVGRFVSQDPIGFAGGINLHAYAGCNPISGIDPDGTASKPCKDALEDLARAISNLAKDLAATAARGRCPNPGHQRKLEQRVTDLKNAIQQVEKYCKGPRWLGPGAAATAALAAARQLLVQAGEYVPEALEGLAGAAAF
jgi:RHS repeat-associated protein